MVMVGGGGGIMVEMLVEDSAEMGRQNGPVTCMVSLGSARPQCGFASRRTFVYNVML